METLVYSKHATQRMQQRGIRKEDIELLLACGTQLHDTSVVMQDKDVAREIARRKQEIRALERLRGCRAVMADGVLVTCYHARPKCLKQSLRQRRRMNGE